MAAGYFILTRLAELLLTWTLMAAIALGSTPHLLRADPTALALAPLIPWVKHQVVYLFLPAQFIVWRIVGRQIELRILALSILVGLYAVALGYPHDFAISFLIAQAGAELAVWRRAERA